MKVLKHIKTGTVSYISHIDTFKVLQRTLVRAGIRVRKSEGYNPHPITYTSHPLPLGVTSECEYFVIANDDMTADDVLTAFNANVPVGMTASQCVEVVKNPNLTAKVRYCGYFARSTKAILCRDDIESYADRDSYCITYDYKGGQKTQDIAGLIHSISVDSDGVHFVIATGNPNLRPDRLIDDINVRCGLDIGINDIVRTEQYIADGDLLTTADEYINGLKI